MLQHTLSQKPAKVRKKNHDDTPNSAMEQYPDEENKENDISHLSHASHEQMTQNIKNDSEMGIIEEIYCENFMCHRKLRVALCPNINFITGENGSGKSAIIAALQICLGASARVTHRAKSIKNLIRHGHDGHALVRITLKNDGHKGSDAFRPELFGKKIIVERLIRRDGSAEYRLKDARLSLVSKSKADLEAMLDHLNIQIENPCAILDQENAKLFLKGDPSGKYEFFLKSTDLYKMRNTYAKIDEETHHIQDTVLKREQAKLDTLEIAKQKAIQQWQESQRMGQLEEEIKSNKQQLAWSFVNEKEQYKNQMVTKKTKRVSMQEELANEWEAIQQQMTLLEEKQQRLNRALDQVTQELTKVQEQKEKAKEEIREARRPLHAYKAELKQLDHKKQQLAQQIQRVYKDIEHKKQAHAKLLEHRMQRNDQLRLEIEAKQKELTQLDQRKQQAERRPTQQDEDDGRGQDLEYQLDQCRRQLKDSEYELTRLDQRIASLKSQKRDSLAVFGTKIPHLQQLIQENSHRFTAPPIGPLGMYVKLPERYQHFALAIEVALKGSLQSYLVVNGKDKALLDDLKRRIKCPPNQATIIIAKRSSRKYENLRCIENEEIARNHAICYLLDIHNDQVFNALVDVCSMESKLLFHDRTTAEQKVLTGSGNNKFRMAKFVSEVFVPNGDKFVVRNGNLAYIANKFQKRSSIICQDVEQEIKELTNKYDFVVQQVDTCKRDEHFLKQKLYDQQKEKRHQTQELEKITRQYHQCQVELNSLQDALTEDGYTNRLDTSVLEEEIVDLQKEQQEITMRQEELTEMLKTCNPNLDGLVKTLEDFHTKEEQLIEETKMLEQDTKSIYETLRELKTQDVRLTKQCEKLKEIVQKYNEEITEIDKEISIITKKAQHICGFDKRVETNETSEFLGKKLTQLTQQIQMERQKFAGMNLQDLFVEKEEKILKFQQKQAQFEKFQKNVVKIRTMLEERQKVWQVLRKEISNRTGLEFNKYMMLNNFAGRLRFKHDDQRLDIAVLRNEVGRTSASKVTDMKELSGGERSYTQVSLLLALGESIECPFRVMDEFDVFMDAVNRDMTIQLLVDAAKRESKKQFIFVTPNDLSTLRKDPMVKIQKMNSPRDRLNAEGNNAH